jgi:hypothetical protein
MQDKSAARTKMQAGAAQVGANAFLTPQATRRHILSGKLLDPPETEVNDRLNLIISLRAMTRTRR